MAWLAYGRPITRTKEYISIMKKVFAREAPVEHDGFHYSLPYSGDDGTGLGKPLKSILQADKDIPIYTASITPNGLAEALEVADGVFPDLDGSSQARVSAPAYRKRSSKVGANDDGI